MQESGSTTTPLSLNSLLLATRSLQVLKDQIFSDDERDRESACGRLYTLQYIAPEVVTLTSAAVAVLQQPVNPEDQLNVALISQTPSLASILRDGSIEYEILDIVFGTNTTSCDNGFPYTIYYTDDGVAQSKDIKDNPAHMLGALPYKKNIQELEQYIEDKLTEDLQNAGVLSHKQRFKLMLSTTHTLRAKYNKETATVDRVLNGILLDGNEEESVLSARTEKAECTAYIEAPELKISPAAPLPICKWVGQEITADKARIQSEVTAQVKVERPEERRRLSKAKMEQGYNAYYPYFLAEVACDQPANFFARIFQTEPYRIAGILGEDVGSSLYRYNADGLATAMRDIIEFISALQSSGRSKANLLPPVDLDTFEKEIKAYKKTEDALHQLLCKYARNGRIVDLSSIVNNYEALGELKEALEAFTVAQKKVGDLKIFKAVEGACSNGIGNWRKSSLTMSDIYGELTTCRTELARQAAKFQKRAEWYGGDKDRLNELFLAPSLPSNLSEAKPQDWFTQAGDVEAGLAFLALPHVQAFMQLPFVKRLDDESVPQAVKQLLSLEWDKEWNKLEGALRQSVCQEKADLVETVQAAGQAIQQAIECSINAASDKVNNVLKAGDVLSGLAGIGAGVALYFGLPVVIPAVLTLVTPTWTLVVLSVATALFVLSLGLGITNQVAFPKAAMLGGRRAHVRRCVVAATLALGLAFFPVLLPTLGVAIPAELATYVIPVLGIIATLLIGVAGGLLLKNEFDAKNELVDNWVVPTRTAIAGLNSNADNDLSRRPAGPILSSSEADARSADETRRGSDSSDDDDIGTIKKPCPGPS